MPRPIPKTEDVLREHEIQDAVRAEVNRLVSGYRRRMLECVPPLIDEFRETYGAGVLTSLDVEAIRYRVGQQERQLTPGV